SARCCQRPRVVTPDAALADRPEQIAQRPIAEKVEALIGDLELELSFLIAASAEASLAAFTVCLEIRKRGDVTLVLEFFDDLANELIEALLGVLARLPVL